MENNHLTYFSVTNFKKFELLEVENIGQFNLIVGDNNVGKTCLLEALLFDDDKSQLLSNFYIALTKRGLKFQVEKVTREVNNVSTSKTIYPKENYFKEYIFGKYFDLITFNYVFNHDDKRRSLDLKINDKENIKKFLKKSEFYKNIPFDDYIKQFICFNVDYVEQVETYWIYDYNLNISNFPLITFNDSSIDNISIELYNNLDIEGEEILLNTLKIINPDLFKIGFKNEFEDLKDLFVLSFKGEKKLIPLNFLGDGFRRIFYIILKALSLRGKRILIDEIEIGIHHSIMKDFWINIMNVCKELDVQLFATTHSQECTESYIEASNILNYNNEIRLIKLEESTNKDKIYASTFTYNQISAGLDSNVELRG